METCEKKVIPGCGECETCLHMRATAEDLLQRANLALGELAAALRSDQTDMLNALLAMTSQTPRSVMSAADIARWCDEEYKRLAARPYAGESYAQASRDGRMSMLAEIAAMCRSGKFAQHCGVREQWTSDQRKQAALDAELFSPVPKKNPADG